MRDILLEKKNGIYDISFENGDFKLTEGLDSSIITSLFSDKRASEAEVSAPELRRGWIGNEQNDDPTYEIGSKLWLLDQARADQKALNDAISFVKDCFNWMILDNIAKRIVVSGVRENETITIKVVFVRFDDTSYSVQFELWENTIIA